MEKAFKMSNTILQILQLRKKFSIRNIQKIIFTLNEATILLPISMTFLAEVLNSNGFFSNKQKFSGREEEK